MNFLIANKHGSRYFSQRLYLSRAWKSYYASQTTMRYHLTPVKMAMRKTKTALKECDIKPLIYELKAEGQHILATLVLTERNTYTLSLVSNIIVEASQ